MNWEMISAIVETVGAVAVVISLVYLAGQVRAENRERRVATVHEISEAYRQTISLLSDPGLAEIMAKSLAGFDKLETAEQIRISSYCMTAFKLFEEAYYQYRQDRLDEYIWAGMLAQMRDSMATDALQSVWQLRRHQFGENFRTLIDEIARSPGQYPLHKESS